jgi:hypothetical protein
MATSTACISGRPPNGRGYPRRNDRQPPSTVMVGAGLTFAPTCLYTRFAVPREAARDHRLRPDRLPAPPGDGPRRSNWFDLILSPWSGAGADRSAGTGRGDRPARKNTDAHAPSRDTDAVPEGQRRGGASTRRSLYARKKGVRPGRFSTPLPWPWLDASVSRGVVPHPRRGPWRVPGAIGTVG